MYQTICCPNQDCIMNHHHCEHLKYRTKGCHNKYLWFLFPSYNLYSLPIFPLLFSALQYWFWVKIFVPSIFHANSALMTFPSLNQLLPIYGLLPYHILQVPWPPIMFLDALGMFYLQLLPGASWVGVVPSLLSLFVDTTSIVYQPPVMLVTLWGLSSQLSSGYMLPLLAASVCSSTTSRDFPRPYSHERHCYQAILLFPMAMLLKVIGNIPPHTFLPTWLLLQFI